LISSAVMHCSLAGQTGTAPGFIALLIFAVWRSIPTQTKARNRNSPVSWMLKLAIVFVCFSLCGAGSFMVSTPHEDKSQHKPNVVPVKNHQLVQRNWMQV
jgi:hypothetical protein